MSRLFAFPFLLFVLVFALMGCNSKNQSMEMLAYSSLSKEEENLIPVSPKDSVIEKIDVTPDVEKFIYDEYNKAEVYSVTFNNTESESHGNLIVFIDAEKLKVVGKGYAD